MSKDGMSRDSCYARNTESGCNVIQATMMVSCVIIVKKTSCHIRDYPKFFPKFFPIGTILDSTGKGQVAD